jgi:hypothetical protein
MIGVVMMNKQEIEKAIGILQYDIKRCKVDNIIDDNDTLPIRRNYREEKIVAYTLAIEVLEQQLTGGWIPVTDGDYIVTIKGGEVIECQSLKI